MDPAESAAASEAVAFSKGWGADNQGESTQVSTVTDSQASVTGESTSQPVETQAESSVSTSTASSVAGTEAASASESQASQAASSVAGTAAGSVADDGKYKQRWLSGQGTVRSQSTTISTLKSENASLAESRAVSPAASHTSVAGSAAQSVHDNIDALEDRYAELLQEGKKSEAIEIRKQIRRLERAEIEADITRKVETATPAAVSAQTEQERINAIAVASYKAQPYLDNKSDQADIDAILFVQAKTGFYINEGYSKPDALQMAVEDAAEKFGTAASATASAAVTQVDSAASSVPGNAEELKNMAAVKTKQTPVKTSQKPKGSGTFADGWTGAAKP